MKILPIGSVPQNLNIVRANRIPFDGNTVPTEDGSQ